MKDPELYILIPVENREKAKEFYIQILGFEEIDSCIYFPQKFCRNVEILLINVDSESKQKNIMLQNNELRFPLFRYFIRDNFLSYCKKLKNSNVYFDKILMTPGGYFAEISDPFGNTMEIWCDSFEEDEDLDINEWQIFKRL